MVFLVWAGSAEAAEPSLRSLLLARHPADLPAAELVDAHGGSPALRALAASDPLLVVRERALLLLAHRVDADTHATCARVFADGPHPRVRAAAIGCLDPGAVLASATLSDALESARASDDPRVRHAADAFVVRLTPSEPTPAAPVGREVP